MSDLFEALKLRIRYDLKDLNDEEFDAYLTALLTPAGSKLSNTLMTLRVNTPAMRTHQTYKVITIRGVKRRIPVTTTKVLEPAPVEDKDCLFELLGYDQKQDIVEQLEADDRSFVVITGFASVGDLAYVDGAWHLIRNLNGENATLEPTCTNQPTKVNSVLDLELVYRVMTND